MQDEYIAKQLTRFDITNAALFELQKNYCWLSIADVNDKDGYKAVREARLTVKNLRIEVEKKRKELLEDSLTYTRAVNAEAKRITSFIEPIEEALAEKEKAHIAEIEALKKAEEEAKAKKFEARIDRLKFIGFRWDGIVYASDFLTASGRPFNLNREGIELLSDEGFDKMMLDLHSGRQKHFAALELEKERKEREEIELKAERERLAQERAEIEAAKKELADKLAGHQQAERKTDMQEIKELMDELLEKDLPELVGGKIIFPPEPTAITVDVQQVDVCSLTPAQKEFIREKIGDWYLKWKNCLIDFDTRTHKLGYAKEELKIMICGETL